MQNIIKYIMDLLYPSHLYCICCGNIIDKSRPYELCNHCMSKLPWYEEGISIIKGVPMVRACLYDDYSKRIVFNLKFKGKRYIARILGEIIADALLAQEVFCLDNFSLITSVPISVKKNNDRGFNQAKLVAIYVAEQLKIPYAELMVRVKNTKPMSHLDKKERQENIKEAFSLKNGVDIKGRGIIIIDDFLTTGSTCSECVSVLKREGAGDCFIGVFASNH